MTNDNDRAAAEAWARDNAKAIEQEVAKQTQVSPGPWTVEKENDRYHTPAAQLTNVVARVGRYYVTSKGNVAPSRADDARLIAAAPDMAAEIEQLKAERAELVEMLQRLISDHEQGLVVWADARAALAKAGGAQ